MSNQHLFEIDFFKYYKCFEQLCPLLNKSINLNLKKNLIDPKLLNSSLREDVFKKLCMYDFSITLE